MRQRRHAFTLVELLVVIGIIALLISVLMPALTAARGSAKLVKCQSDFKSIYNAVLFYANANKGMLPIASDPNNWENQGTNAGNFIELSDMLGSPINDANQVEGVLSPVFRCSEGLEGDDGVVWAPQLIRDIKFHPRAFPGYDQLAAMPQEYPQRKLVSIKNAAEKIAFWEGPQIPTWNLSTEPEAIFTDGWRWNWSHQYTDPPADLPAGQSVANYARWNQPVDTGANLDNGWWSCSMRFRHNRNKNGPFAFFDGHVEVRPVGGVVVREICINK